MRNRLVCNPQLPGRCPVSLPNCKLLKRLGLGWLYLVLRFCFIKYVHEWLKHASRSCSANSLCIIHYQFPQFCRSYLAEACRKATCCCSRNRVTGSELWYTLYSIFLMCKLCFFIIMCTGFCNLSALIVSGSRCPSLCQPPRMDRGLLGSSCWWWPSWQTRERSIWRSVQRPRGASRRNGRCCECRPSSGEKNGYPEAAATGRNNRGRCS